MFEDQTFDVIMERCLGAVSDDMDKREGSIIYDALAPAVLELVNMYISLDIFLDEAFADTASRDYLIRRAAERGLEPEEATYAVIIGQFNCAVDIGTRFNHEDLNYCVTELIDDDEHTYYLKCETAGEEGNQYTSGNLTPIDYVSGLTSAVIVSLYTAGEDAEDTEDFRQRYYDSLTSQAFGGNVADYKEKVLAVDGVGGVKVYRAEDWNGAGTVKLVIQSSEYGVPDSDLIEELQEMIDPTANSGEGVGIAPIGHIVTVMGAQGTETEIAITVELQSSHSLEDVEEEILKVVKAYLGELNESWGDGDSSDKLEIKWAQIVSRVSDVAGVSDISDVNINGRGSFVNTELLESEEIFDLDSTTVNITVTTEDSE